MFFPTMTYFIDTSFCSPQTAVFSMPDVRLDNYITISISLHIIDRVLLRN